MLLLLEYWALSCGLQDEGLPCLYGGRVGVYVVCSCLLVGCI